MFGGRNTILRLALLLILYCRLTRQREFPPKMLSFTNTLHAAPSTINLSAYSLKRGAERRGLAANAAADRPGKRGHRRGVAEAAAVAERR